MADVNNCTTSNSSYSPHPEPEIDSATFASYLDRNPAFLESYIRKKWTLEQLDRVRHQLLSTETSPQPNPSKGANEQSNSYLNNCVNTRAFPNGSLIGRKGTTSESSCVHAQVPFWLLCGLAILIMRKTTPYFHHLFSLIRMLLFRPSLKT